jgi:hypothetical protein
LVKIVEGRAVPVPGASASWYATKDNDIKPESAWFLWGSS